MLTRRYLDHSWLLATNERLDGTHLATVRLRPLRTALLVFDRDIRAAAVESCCVSWGGYANIIVAYSEPEGIKEPWRKLLEVVEPDLFVCFENEPPDEVEGHLRRKSNSRVFSHGSYQYATLVTGTLIYAILDTFMDPQRVDN